MSTIDYKEFDLEGLSLEEMETVETETTNKVDVAENDIANNENVIEVKTTEPLQVAESLHIEESIELVQTPTQAGSDEEQITCPKCQLQQPKVEQCVGCGVYVEKAMAQIGQSKIQITATKF